MNLRILGWPIWCVRFNSATLTVQQFWIPGNLELFVLRSYEKGRPQIEVVSFTKSATTNQPSPDNTRYAFLQMDDRVMVYRGADQPDLSVINPESDIWQSIKVHRLDRTLRATLADIYFVDPNRIHCYKLANTLRLDIVRWKVDRGCRSSRSHTLFSDIWKMETVSG